MADISRRRGRNLVRAGLLRTLIERLERDASRALPHAHALLAMHPEDETVAAALKSLSERARAQAAALPTQPMVEGDHAISPPRPVPMSGQSPAADIRAPDTEAERKYVTVLSVDIVSPLDAFASVDPELIMRQIGPLIESTFGIVELHGGIVSTSGGSHVTAVFGALPASGHHAVSACRAALIVKSTIEKQSEGSVRVRAGLGTEWAEVTGAAASTALRLTPVAAAWRAGGDRSDALRGCRPVRDESAGAIGRSQDSIETSRAYELQGVGVRRIGGRSDSSATLDDIGAVCVQVGNDRFYVRRGNLAFLERSPEQSDHLVECRVVDLQMGVHLAQRGSAVARWPSHHGRDELGLMVDETPHVDVREERSDGGGGQHAIVEAQHESGDGARWPPVDGSAASAKSRWCERF